MVNDCRPRHAPFPPSFNIRRALDNVIVSDIEQSRHQRYIIEIHQAERLARHEPIPRLGKFTFSDIKMALEATSRFRNGLLIQDSGVLAEAEGG